MAYVKTNWADGQAPALSAANMNKIEQGIFDASATADSAKTTAESIINTMADYIVDEGADGLWTYRKWNSGKVEAWAVYPFGSASWNVWNNPIRYMDKTINIPSGIFASAPTMMATSPSNQYWIANCEASSDVAASMRIASVASTAMATSANIYAWTN